MFSRAIAFKNAGRFDPAVEANIVVHEAASDRVEYVADLAQNWAGLARAKTANRRVAVVLANYPNRDGRLGNGVGLDTPAGTINVLNVMAEQGYRIGELPPDGDALIKHLQAGPTNAAHDGRVIRETISLNHYKTFFQSLSVQIQNQVVEKWGEAEADPFFLSEQNAFALPLASFGNIVIGVQPARGYNIDPKGNLSLAGPCSAARIFCFLCVA